MSENENYTKKKCLKTKYSEDNLFVWVKVNAKCDFVFAARWNFSHTPFAKGAIVANYIMSLLCRKLKPV
jgi:hypothetical protein